MHVLGLPLLPNFPFRMLSHNARYTKRMPLVAKINMTITNNNGFEVLETHNLNKKANY